MTQRSSCSSSSPINKFDVFDFSEDSKTEKMFRKFRTPMKSPSPPISKYEFLQACKSHFSLNSSFYFLNFDSFFVHSFIQFGFYAVADGSKPQSRIVSIDLGIVHAKTSPTFSIAWFRFLFYFLYHLNFGLILKIMMIKKMLNVRQWKFWTNR